MRNSQQGAADFHCDRDNVECQKLEKLSNGGGPPPPAVEEPSFRLSNISDNMEPPPPSDDNDSVMEDDGLQARWDSWAPPPCSGPTVSNQPSPLSRSPWSSFVERSAPETTDSHSNYTGLMTSLVREEGNIYSLAAMGDMLYTGSDSKNIRIWKNQTEYSGFKANSGLVKAIVIANDQKIFTGHQDGKIRVWKFSPKNPSVHKRIGTLPTFKSVVKKSMKPKNYTEVRRNHNAIWIKHFDAISSLSLSEDQSLLYSGSWDKTIKVWRISDFKCLESISAHEDAINAVATGFDCLIFSGSADGTVKAWRMELQGKRTKHFFSHTLLKQECAVTSLVVNQARTVVYGGSSDGVIHFWEREKLMSHGGALRGHKLAVLCLATADNLVFSGSADANICVWRRDDGGEHTCLHVLTGHSGPVKCLAVEDERWGVVSRRDSGGDRVWIVYSGSLDRSVKIWRVSTQKPPPVESQTSLPPPQRPCNSALPSNSAPERGSQSENLIDGGGGGGM